MELLCDGCGQPMPENEGTWCMIGADVSFCCRSCIDTIHEARYAQEAL